MHIHIRAPPPHTLGTIAFFSGLGGSLGSMVLPSIPPLVCEDFGSIPFLPSLPGHSLLPDTASRAAARLSSAASRALSSSAHLRASSWQLLRNSAMIASALSLAGAAEGGAGFCGAAPGRRAACMAVIASPVCRDGFVGSGGRERVRERERERVRG